ncbi:hypothetical protein BaRGS_00034570, partial [Batillaria attramentaria]
YPTDVTVQIFIVSFDSISEATMDYSLTIFLRQTWNDSRLEYPPLPGIEALELDTRVMKRIWVPDLYFTNEKQANFHDVTVPNKLMHITFAGQVLYSSRISMKLSCDMDLWRFPFDSQTCYLSMESYSYSTENVIFQWHKDPVQKRDDMSLPQFEFHDFTHMDCTKVYIGANYTCIRAEFHLVRSYGYYMAQVYIPSVLVVILSWVSFWLDIDAIPARISLGLLTEFAYVNVNARVEKRRQSVHGGLKLGTRAAPSRTNSESGAETETNGRSSCSIVCLALQEKENGGGRKRLFSKTTVSRQRARRLDKISRLAFPAVFGVFNLIYWTFYMLWPEDHN